MRGCFAICFLLLVTEGALAQNQIRIDSIVLVQQSQIIESAERLHTIVDTLYLSNSRSSIFFYLGPYNQSTAYTYTLSRIYPFPVVTRNRYLAFNNLPIGEYNLEVSGHGTANTGKIQLLIIVEAPLWLRWWFLPVVCFYVMLILAVGFYFLYKYRIRQVLRLHSVRDSIARDLHDEVGSYLSSISVMTQAVANLSNKDPRRARDLTLRIGETARHVIDSMGEIIWSVNPGNDSLEMLTIHMRDVAGEILGEQEIDFVFEAGENILEQYLSLSKRRDFLLIYKEVLTNTMKYAKADRVGVVVDRRDDFLVLSITDNGVGFNIDQITPQSVFGGNGLANIRVRAERIGATLEIRSDSEEGTVTILRLSKDT